MSIWRRRGLDFGVPGWKSNPGLPPEPGFTMTGSKRLDHWTSGTVYEFSEIAGSPQSVDLTATRLAVLSH